MVKPILITITGPESTGKTVLARELAERFGAALVEDVSRMAIEKIGEHYTAANVVDIAEKILAEEDAALASGAAVVVSDNDLLNIKIWMEYYGWSVPPALLREMEIRRSDLYLLCNIDLAWVADDQRKNEHDRQHLFSRFEHELQNADVHPVLVTGTDAERTKAAVQAMEKIIR